MISSLQSGNNRDRYVLNLYASAKERFLENLDDAEIQRRFIGLGTSEDDTRLQSILSWQADYKAGLASISVFKIQNSPIRN